MVRLQGIFVVAVALFLSMMLPSGSWSVVEEGEWGAPEPDLRGLDYVVVDPSGGGDYGSIQEALDAVDENGTVLIRAGNYTEKVWINHSLTLMGEEKGKVIFKVDEANVSMIRVRSDYVSLINITIDGSFHNLSWYEQSHPVTGIEIVGNRSVSYDNIYISHCNLTGIFKGIKIDEASNVSLINNTFYNCLQSISYNCDFLEVERGFGLKVKRNKFVIDLNEQHSGFMDIFIHGNKMSIINNTHISRVGVRGNGVFIRGGRVENASIVGNTVLGNGDIIIDGAANVTISGNYIQNVMKIIMRTLPFTISKTRLIMSNTIINCDRILAYVVDRNYIVNVSSILSCDVLNNMILGFSYIDSYGRVLNNTMVNGGYVIGDVIGRNHFSNCEGPINGIGVYRNSIVNCTKGIVVRAHFITIPIEPRIIKDNIMIGSGIHVNITYCPGKEAIGNVSIINNTVDGKPVVVWNFTDNLEITGTMNFSQVILLGCNNFKIHGIKISREVTYPIIQVGLGEGGEIYGCDFGGGDPAIKLEKTREVAIYGNRIRGGRSGIILRDSSGIEVYGNIFEVGNGSFYDSGSNDWYSGAEGNLWTNVSLRDEDLDGYGDEPVRIPGGGGEDRHPAYPYMRLEVRSYVEEGTTGEGIPLGLGVWVPDYSFEVISDVKLVWMRGEERWERDFGAVEGEWDFVIGLNESSTEPVRIWMEGRDLYGGEYRSEEIVVEVVDNDPPEVVGVDMPGSLANGDEFEVKVYARDNVGVEGVELEVMWDEGYRSVLRLEYDGGVWRGSLRVPDNVSGEALVVLRVEDLGGNVVYYNSTMEVRDTVGPVIEEDETPTVVDCGEVLEFRIRVWDASGVGRVVVYLSGGVVDVVELEEEGGYYVGEYEVPVEVTVLRYYVYAEDVVGNSVSGEEREVEVRDVIPPYIEFRGVPESVGTGEFLRVGVVYGDNVGVESGWVLVLINGEEWRNLTLGDVEVEMPEDEVGSVILRGVVVDVSGWRDEFESVEIELVDVISPEIELGRGEVRLREGEELRMEINVSDNIGVESVEWWWSGDGKWREGREIELRVGKAGEYQIKVRAYDGAGNVEEVNVTVVVERGEGSGDGEDGGGGFWVWVAVLGVAVAVVFVVLLYVKGRGGGEGMFEEPGGEEDLSGEGMGSLPPPEQV